MALTELQKIDLEMLDRELARRKSKTKKPSEGITERLSSSKQFEPTGDPVIDKLIFTQKEIVGPVVQGANTALFGLPKAITKKISPQSASEIFPEQSTLGGKSSRVLLETAGLLKGGSAQTAKKVGQFASKAGKTVQRATEGASFGLTQLDVSDSETGPTVKGQLTQAAGGGVAGVFFGKLQQASNSINRATKGAPAFARKVRDAIFNRKKQASDLFGEQLNNLATNNPTRSVSLRSTVEKINAEAAFEPRLNSIIRRTPSIKRLLDNPQLADDVPVNEVQTIINDIGSKISKTRAGGRIIGKVKPDEIPIFDAIDDIRSAQIDAFPEMGKIRTDYKNVISKYNLIKGKIREGSLLKNLSTDFGDRELKEAADSLLTKEILNEARSFKKVSNTLDASKKLLFRGLEGAAVGTAGAVAATKIFNRP